MEFTGERFVPQLGGQIAYEHYHRYALAAAYADGCDVLDAACGEGYGSAMLARRARSVTGIDIDQRTVDAATATYAGTPGLEFRRADCAALPLPDAAFDLVVSFETIEHVASPDLLLSELRRVLRPDGLLIISSRNRHRYPGESGHVDAREVRAFNVAEFHALLQQHFDAIDLMGQSLSAVSIVTPLTDDRPEVSRPSTYGGFTRRRSSLGPGIGGPQQPSHVLGVCRKEASVDQERPMPSIYTDETDDLWRKQETILHWASGMDHEVTALREQSNAARSERDRFEREFKASQEATEVTREIIVRHQTVVDLLAAEAAQAALRLDALMTQNAALMHRLHEAEKTLLVKTEVAQRLEDLKEQNGILSQRLRETEDMLWRERHQSFGLLREFDMMEDARKGLEKSIAGVVDR